MFCILVENWYINPFQAKIQSVTPWKLQKISGFLTFLDDLEIKYIGPQRFN